MEVYKDRQFLVFHSEGEPDVKYDFATHTAIGKRGKPVKSLSSQLAGVTFKDVIAACKDENYGRFLEFVRRQNGYRPNQISTILRDIPKYSSYEQVFSAGVKDVRTCQEIKNIPAGAIKLCKAYDWTLCDDFIRGYRENPDLFHLIPTLNYISLTIKEAWKLACARRYDHAQVRNVFNYLINQYGYNAKSLLLYIDRLVTFEALDAEPQILREITDYASMMSRISPKFDRYPRHLLSTHRLAIRNYTRMAAQFDEQAFQRRRDPEMEVRFGSWRFIYPTSTQDIKDEAAQQHNCVASYIQRVLDGDCHILFLRRADHPDKSVVTCEVVQGKIIQARQAFNDPLTEEQAGLVERWNQWYQNRAKSSESQEVA